MNRSEATQKLRYWNNQGKFVFTKHELTKLFPNDNPKTLSEGLRRLVTAGILLNPCRNIYINPNSQHLDSYLIENIAKAVRKGEYNYLSLESALSEYGAISQIPIDRITIMTTGRKGIYKTPYGIIEFTHTKRPAIDIIKNTYLDSKRPLRIATKATAWRDLKRVGRNVNLVSQEEINHDKKR